MWDELALGEVEFVVRKEGRSWVLPLLWSGLHDFVYSSTYVGTDTFKGTLRTDVKERSQHKKM